MTAAGTEIDACSLDINRDRSCRLDKVPVDVRPVVVGEITDGLEVMLKAIQVRNQGNGDQFRLSVDRLLEVGHFDSPITWFHEPHIHALRL